MTVEELTLEYMDNDIYIIQHGFSSYTRLNIKPYKLNLLHCISLPGYSFDCFLMISRVALGSIQNEQTLKDFIDSIRGGMCGVLVFG